MSMRHRVSLCGLVLATAATSHVNANLLQFLGRSPVLPAAEISAFDPLSDRLLTVGPGGVEILNFANPAAPTPIGSLLFSAPAGFVAEPNSVAIHNGVAAIAVAVKNATTNAHSNGFVRFVNVGTGLQLGSDVAVGHLPDMVTFTPDGKRVLTANEGEPNSYGQADSFDPEGSISIIDISGGFASPTVQTAGFTSFNSQINTLRNAGVRIFGPGATVAQDLEPEYITINGQTAYVTLQEANALAYVDIPSATVTQIVPLGLKNHNLPGNGMDPSDRDGVNIRNVPVFGMYQPDAIASMEVGGVVYLLTANEGDSRDYTGFSEEVRVGSSAYVLDPTQFPNAAALKNNADLGRLQLTGLAAGLAGGNLDGDGDIDRIQAFGARSFSIWNAATGELVWDSGDQFEQITAVTSPTTFNSDGTTSSFDSRSDNKGPEPEAVAVGSVGGQTYAFIGLERIGGIMVYNVTDPLAPTFVQYINAGDLGPEGLIFISADDSPNGQPLIVVSNERSNTVAVYAIPEPTTMALLTLGGIAMLRRRNNRA